MTRPVVDHWTLPTAERHRVERELRAGESIVWLGRPNPRRAVLQTLPILLFAVPWTGFALFWTAGAAGFKMPNFSGPGAFFPLFGLPFIGIGLLMLSAPLLALRAARRTVYMITDRRAVIFEAQMVGLKVRSFSPERFDEVERHERKDGSGDLIFERHVTKHENAGVSTRLTAFRAVPNVREVETILHEVAELHRPMPLPGGGRPPDPEA